MHQHWSENIVNIIYEENFKPSKHSEHAYRQYLALCNNLMGGLTTYLGI